jgi:hypothetical protein
MGGTLVCAHTQIPKRKDHVYGVEKGDKSALTVAGGKRLRCCMFDTKFMYFSYFALFYSWEGTGLYKVGWDEEGVLR